MTIDEKRCLEECYDKLVHSDFPEHYRRILEEIKKKL